MASFYEKICRNDAIKKLSKNVFTTKLRILFPTSFCPRISLPLQIVQYIRSTEESEMIN